MSNYQVPEPIINSPYDEPRQHWNIVEGEQPELLPDRRRAVYFYRDPKAKAGKDYRGDRGVPIELKLVNLVRERVKAWRDAGLSRRNANDERTASMVEDERVGKSACSSRRLKRPRP